MKQVVTGALLAGLTAGALLPGSALCADLEKGKTLYAQRCAMCHGDKGEGDGVAASAFPADQKPRSLSGGAMKFATDGAKFKELIKKGGVAVGLSPLMPMQPDLADADIDGLYAFVQSLKK